MDRAMPFPARVHDLTATLETHMPTWPTSPLPVFEPTAFLARDGVNMERISCTSHTGTHVDAPYHFVEDGRTVDTIPPGDLVGPAVVLDVRAEIEGTFIRRASLVKHWPKGPAPAFALLRTDWSRHRAPTQRYLYDFPGLEVPAAEFLVEQGIRGVGIDTLGIDVYANSKYEAHQVLLRRGIWVIEALDHLDQLREGVRYTLVVAPLKIRGGSGAMSRVLALEA